MRTAPAAGAWPWACEWLALLLAALLVGVAVKLMDDGLDVELDRAAGLPNWAAALGRGALPYALAALCAGVAVRPAAGAALFLAAYALGMGQAWREPLPSRVPAWVEILAALALAVALSGWRVALAALLAMAAVQLADDALDLRADPLAGRRAWSVWLGRPGLWIAAFACLLWAAVLDWPLAAAAGAAATALQAINRRLRRCRDR